MKYTDSQVGNPTIKVGPLTLTRPIIPNHRELFNEDIINKLINEVIENALPPVIISNDNIDMYKEFARTYAFFRTNIPKKDSLVGVSKFEVLTSAYPIAKSFKECRISRQQLLDQCQYFIEALDNAIEAVISPEKSVRNNMAPHFNRFKSTSNLSVYS